MALAYFNLRVRIKKGFDKVRKKNAKNAVTKYEKERIFVPRAVLLWARKKNL